MGTRVLIAGLGSIGRRHLRLAREILPDAEIRILRHAPGSAVPEGADGVFSRPEEALAFRPELSVIANPAPLHLGIGGALAQAGSHLLVEKPLSASGSEADDFIKTMPREICVLVGYNLRFAPALRRFRDLLVEGIVGRVLSARAEIGQHLESWRPGTDYRESVSAKKELGGGVLLELSHEFDYLRWVFGEARTVQGFTGKQSALEVNVEDSAHLVIEFSANHGVVPASVNMDFYRHDRTRTCLAIGEKGSLRWDAMNGTVEHYAEGAARWEQIFASAPQPDETYRLEWKHWLECIAQGTAPEISVADGRAVLAIVEAARSASESGVRQVVR